MATNYKREDIPNDVQVRFDASRLREQQIKENIKYIGKQKGISIYYLYQELNRRGTRISKTMFYKKPDDPSNKKFLTTFMIESIAMILQVSPYLLWSDDIERDYLKSLDKSALNQTA